MNGRSLLGRIFLSSFLVALIAGVAFADTPGEWSRIPEEDAHPRMATSLQLLAMEAQVGPQRLEETAGDLGIELENGDVVVIVEPASGRATRVDEIAVRALGGEVEARSESLLRVRVPADRLFDLADWVSGVAFIREPLEPRALAVTSQGVALTGAIDFHNAGYLGQGAKVAIIDLGFDGYTEARAAGELDNVVFTHDYTGDGFEAVMVHGTGVAETVADMAPQADLYLMLIGDTVDLQNAVSDCIANGVQVINHSVGWFNSNYYDGTGFIAGLASTARSNGILWCNSAGNEGDDGHWQGDFVDVDGDGYHDFGTGNDSIDGDARDEGNHVLAYAGEEIRVFMTWNDWIDRDQNYDLYLYNSGGVAVASSTNNQTGWQQPTERIYYVAPTTGYYEIAIRRVSVSAPMPEIEIFTYLDSGYGPDLEYHVAESSILTPGNSGDVFTVGAIRQSIWATGPQESFSSQGPSNDSVYAPSITKPDIAGPDGTSNYTYGNFYGTSASSPHVAGAAALLISEDPIRTVVDLQTKLESDAIDMGAAGKDNVYGSGRLALELTPATPPPPEGTVGYWRFDEGSGSTTVDSSGNGNDGTIVGATRVIDGSADGSDALSFDGVDDYVVIPNTASLNPTSALTIEAWIKPDAVTSGAQKVVVEKAYTSATTPYYQYCLTTWGTEIVLYVTVDGQLEYVVSTGAGLTAGTWTHVAGVYDGQDLKVYVGGTLRGTTNVGAGVISSYGMPLLIGKHWNYGIDRFPGAMDEVRVHAEALVPGEFNLPSAVDNPPTLVTDFTASDGEDGQSTLSWTNPSDLDLKTVVVLRREGSYPSGHSDVTAVEVVNDTNPTEGGPGSYTDTGRTNGTMYYYAVFGEDDAGQWNDTVAPGSNADTGTPAEPGAVTPVGYWRFEVAQEGNGQTALDSSGNGNDGTIVGATRVIDGSADGSDALSFDGVDDYVVIPNTASLNPTSALTIEAWIKPDAVTSGAQKVVVEKAYTSATTPYYQYCLTTWGTEIVLYVTVDGQLEYVVSTGAGLTAGTWTHVAGVYDGQDLKVYVGGTLRGTTNVGAGVISSYGMPLLIGKHWNYGIDRFPGAMDEVRVHAEALVPGEFNLPSAVDNPPTLVTDFTASDGEDGQSTLSWTNPSDLDLKTVVVLRREGSYPSGHSDVTAVEVVNDTNPTEGGPGSYTDTGRTNGTMYYYAVFGEDDAGQWNDTVAPGSNADTGTPAEPGAVTPVGYWRFEVAQEGNGQTALDSSGNGNDGTIVGATRVIDGSADGSDALSFDGVDDYVVIPNTASLNPTSALTIEAWIKPDAVTSGAQKVVVEKAYTSATTPYYQYCLTTWGTEIVLYVTVDGQLEYVVSTGAGLTAGTWTHVAGVYDGQDLKVYVGGTLRGTTNVGAGVISSYGMPLLIGKHWNYGIDRFPGAMDEVRVHAEALVPGEFGTLAMATSWEPVIHLGFGTPSGLVAPNPVVSTGRFEVRGILATELRVSIYDLSAKRVFDSGWRAGSTLVWDRRNDWGERLANGPYIYVIQTRQEDETERIWPPQKLFLR